MGISIVTASLDQGRFVREALESVRRQSSVCAEHLLVEHLVYDGGSTDETVALLQALEGRAEWRHVRWSSGADGGQSAALNRGFAEAKGEIVGWLNADDRYRAGCFERVARAFAENPDVDVFYGDYTLMDEWGKVTRVRREIGFNRFVLKYHRVLYIATAATFFRRRIFEDGYRLKDELHYAMDYEFFLRLAQAGYRIERLPEVLADFRVHAASKSSRMTRVQLEERRGILRKALAAEQGMGRVRRMLVPGLQAAAALRRWGEKALRGHYLVQYLAAVDGDEGGE